MMDSDKMRAEFESWSEDNDCGKTLAATSATGFYTRNIAWTAWQAAYAAGRKAEREAFVSKLRSEIDHAALNAMQLKPMFGQSKGDLAVRVSTLEAIIENREGE